MAWGDWRYRMRVSPESQAFAQEHNLADANVFVPSPEGVPYYPESLRRFLAAAGQAEAPEGVNGDGNGAGGETSPSPGSAEGSDEPA